MSNVVVFDTITGDVKYAGQIRDSDIELQELGANQSLVILDEPFDPITQTFDHETGEISPLVISDEQQIAAAKVELLGRAAAQFTLLVGKGFEFNGANYQIDDYSRGNMTAIATRGGIAPATWPGDGYPWIATDNTVTLFATPADFITFGVAVSDYYGSLVFALRSIKDAVLALPDLAACAAFDVKQGWPA